MRQPTDFEQGKRLIKHVVGSHSPPTGLSQAGHLLAGTSVRRVGGGEQSEEAAGIDEHFLGTDLSAWDAL